MKLYRTVIVTEEDGVGVITLNRPTLLNALNTQMRAEITDALHDLGQRMRVVVLTGEGRAFCSGQDLGAETSVKDMDLGRVLRDEYAPMITAIAECPVPVISAVNGTAAGAGANLALAADVVIAKQSAVFLQAFARIGLMPDAGGTYVLPRLAGFAQAMGQSLFAEPVTADQAEARGLIWASVPDEDFADEWRRRARQLADGPTLAYRAIKRAIRQSGSHTLAEQLEIEAQLQGDLGGTRDVREGVLAFLEKRKAKFEGR